MVPFLQCPPVHVPGLQGVPSSQMLPLPLLSAQLCRDGAAGRPDPPRSLGLAVAMEAVTVFPHLHPQPLLATLDPKQKGLVYWQER